MSELLPCPFCGGEANLYSDYSSERDETRWEIWHECSGHEGEGAGYGHGYHPWFETPWYKTEAEAVAAWNTRAERTCHVVSTIRYDYEGGYAGFEYVTELSCGHLYHDTYGDAPNYCNECGAKVVGS